MDESLLDIVNSMLENHSEVERLSALTDLSDESVSTESAQGLLALVASQYAVGQESGGVLGSLKKKLSSFASTAWDDFIDALDNSRSQAENKLNGLSYLREKVDRATNLGGGGSVSSQLQFNKLQLKGKLPDVKSILNAAEQLATVTESELNDEMDYILRVSSKMIPDIDKLLHLTVDGKDYSTLSTHLGRIGEYGNLTVIRRNGLKYFSRAMDSDGKELYQTVELPGNVRVISSVVPYEASGLRSMGYNQFKTVTNIFSMRTRIDYGSSGSMDDRVPKMSQYEIEQAIKICERICNSIIGFKIRYGNRFSQTKRQFGKLRDSLDRVGRGGENVESKIYLRKAADAAHATSRWIHTPAMPMIGHNLRVVTALMSYINASIDTTT